MDNLYTDISHFQAQGNVLLCGDLNASTGSEIDYVDPQVVERRQHMTSVPEPEEGILIKLKFSDGRLQRRRFETHQDLVAFAGMDDMSSEVFSLQLAMSPTPILSTSTGTLADNGIHESCTMYVLWMAGHEVEEVLESQRSPIRSRPTSPPQMESSPPHSPFPSLDTDTLTSPPHSPFPSMDMDTLTSPPHSTFPSLYADSLTSPRRMTSPKHPTHNISPISPQLSDMFEDHVVDVTSNEVDAWVMLKHLKSKIDFTSSPSANLVNVCRDDVLGCAIRAFQRPLFDPCRKVDIIFVDDWDLRCGG
ncbi:uncharacterized protein LOC125300046 isoform X2 [Alosa alosa]|nr:uncharacterized protein LOC125300046 isoform X2 [Alosa alosa]